MNCSTNMAIHDVDGADPDNPIFHVLLPPAAPLPPPLAPPAPPLPTVTASSKGKRKLTEPYLSVHWHQITGMHVYRDEHPEMSDKEVAVSWIRITPETRNNYNTIAAERRMELMNYVNKKRLPQPKENGYQVFLQWFKKNHEPPDGEFKDQPMVEGAKLFWKSLSDEEKAEFEGQKLAIDMLIEKSINFDLNP